MNVARARSTHRRRPPAPLVRLSPAGPDDTARGVEPAAHGATPSSAARGNETSDIIRQALGRLPADDRDIIERHDFDGLSLRQIAARRGVREDEVRRSYY